jgi:hypothetical protein
MYVEILANAQVSENPTKLKILKAPADFLLHSKFRINDILQWKDLDVVQKIASEIGCQVNIQYPNQKKQYPIPTVSEEIKDLIAGFPYDLKIKLNGLIYEQRLYVMALTHHEVAKNSDSAKLLKEAEYWLIEYCRNVIIKEEPKIQWLLDKADESCMREKLLDLIMSWTPDWEQILNARFGERFIVGNSEFEIIGYYRKSSGKDRKEVRVLCELVEILDLVPHQANIPTIVKNDLCVLGTFQVESLLKKRLG